MARRLLYFYIIYNKYNKFYHSLIKFKGISYRLPFFLFRIVYVVPFKILMTFSFIYCKKYFA